MHKEFVYIDSSQEEDNSRVLKPLPQRNQPKFQQIPMISSTSPKHRHCVAHNPQTHLLKQSEYDYLVKNLITQKIGKEMKKKLITNIEDYELANDINKRNANYKYFLQKMSIDQKYRASQQQISNKLKQENEKKKKILYQHQTEEQLKRQEDELRKYHVEKRQKQQRAVQHVKKQIRKLGFQRVYHAHKKIKEQIKNKQIKKQDQLASQVNKQRNQLLELQEQFQRIKQQKRINKLEQRKVIKQLAEKVMSERQLISEKYTKKQTFIV